MKARAARSRGALLHLLLLLALSGLLAGPLRASAALPALSAPHSEPAGHTGGGPCHDPDAAGQPCASSCLCLCCPGHAAGMTFLVDKALPEDSLTSPLEVRAPRDLHPEDALCCIFHPPSRPHLLS